MQTDWDAAIAFVLKEEGGYTVDPNDRGGETNFGISKRAYPSEDIKNLTEARARELYRRDYWNACRCDELPSPLAVAVFDSAVNQGTGAATRMLQIALGVDADGVLGDKTITAAHKSADGTVRRFLAQRMVRYIRTIVKDTTQEAFAETWSNRLMRLAQLVWTGGGHGS